jgi:hypothetical protein
VQELHIAVPRWMRMNLDRLARRADQRRRLSTNDNFRSANGAFHSRRLRWQQNLLAPFAVILLASVA